MACRSIPLQAPYCGAKHAVKGFTESVMCELAHERSRVKLCMVQLPGLNTTQFRWNLSKMPKHPMPVQQTDKDLPRLGPNVFQPRDGDEDQGAHGGFGDQAHARDPQLWLSTHRGAILGGAAAAAAAAAVALSRR